MTTKRVLLVEDEERYYRQIVQDLQGLDIELIIKTTYGEGMQALREGSYALLIFDGKIENISEAGLELTQAAGRLVNPRPPIILHTNFPRSNRMVEQAIRLGAVYVWKERSACDLRQQVEELL